MKKKIFSQIEQKKFLQMIRNKKRFKNVLINKTRFERFLRMVVNKNKCGQINFRQTGRGGYTLVAQYFEGVRAISNFFIYLFIYLFIFYDKICHGKKSRKRKKATFLLLRALKCSLFSFLFAQNLLVKKMPSKHHTTYFES